MNPKIDSRLRLIMWHALIVAAGFLAPARNATGAMVTQVAPGENHTLFLKSDGSLWATGIGLYGQLGDGTTNFSISVPEQIVSGGVTAIAAGWDHSLFIKSDGSLWGMGFNRYGQLGDGTTNYAVTTPELIVASNVTAVAAGANYTLFLKKDGSLWAMGKNETGELGDGTTNMAVYPEMIVSSNVVAISAKGECSLFLKSDGSAWEMGSHFDYGPMWFYDDQDVLIPEEIMAGNITAIAAGNAFFLFLKSDRSLWGVGFNQIGELGAATTNSFSIVTTPQELSSDVTAIATGEDNSFFFKSDGSLWAMGFDGTGELGDGRQVWGVPIAEQIAAAGVAKVFPGFTDTFFLKSDGSLWGAGWNGSGGLGDGTYTENVVNPEFLFGPPTISGLGFIGSAVVLNSSNGTAGATYYLKSSTNPTLPLSQWTSIATNTLSVAGGFSFTNVVDSNIRQAFYVLQLQ